MSEIMFDTHHFIKKLTAVGFTEEQAEVQAETIVGLIDDQLATKKDLLVLEQGLKTEMSQIEERLSYKLTIRLGSMLVVGISIVTALVKI